MQSAETMRRAGIYGNRKANKCKRSISVVVGGLMERR